jgi:eukaryotic-like serine/threonine-protein kinase
MDARRELEDTLYYAALQLDGPARRLFLDQACVDNPSLRAALDELLSAQDEADRLLERGRGALGLSPGERDTLVQDLATTIETPIDERIGRYRLVARLGEGGFGTVFLAEQSEPVRREVALKVIKPGMDTRRVIARFAAEQQALALMEHPNIARVLDAGVTPAGRPFFVMELVRGERITTYCDQHRLDLRRRLELFLQVCGAIRHAHQKGLIHRDIKPSNILVADSADGPPVPKVIDFGIAKAITDHPAEGATFASAHEQLMGTPAYMSPEQADNPAIEADTRSDIYSLGALLNELLTGKPPFDGAELARLPPEQLRRLLREQEPPRPSTLVSRLPPDELRLVAENRGIEPGRLAVELRGDLDWIVLKTLEKTPIRRYETVNGLAADIRRHLNDEPVTASPPDPWYRARKLARRHRGAFVAAAAVLASLLLGLGATSWMFVKERHARQEQAVLREQAVARETITRAAIAVNNGDFALADSLLERVNNVSPELSFDSVSAYRSVGEWHALGARWDKAAERFQALMEIDRLDTWEVITLDYQSCGVVLAESGALGPYRDFCRAALAHFATIDNGDAAGRIVKTVLLLPPSPELIEGLQPLINLNHQHWHQVASSQANYAPGWETIPLALAELRLGDFGGAARRCEALLSRSRPAAALGETCRIIHALARHRQNRDPRAGAWLASARSAIEAHFAAGITRGQSRDGYWFDWLFARILLREALAEIK